METDIRALKAQKNNVALILIILLQLQGVVTLLSGGKGAIGFDVVSMITFIAIFVMIYIYQSEIFIKYLWFFIVSAWGVFAVYMLENGDILLRGQPSTHYGSLPIYVLGWEVFWAVIAWKEICRKRKLASESSKQNYSEILPRKTEVHTLKIISYLAVALMAVCFLCIANKPYFIYGIDRFQYNQSIMPQFVSNCMLILYAIIPIPIMLRKEKKWIPIVYCTLFLLLNAWCGEKFTGLIIIFYFIILSINPSFISKKVSRNIKKLIVLVGCIIVALLILVTVQQFVLGLGVDDISNYFENRIAAQGEVWWLMYAKEAGQGMHLDELSDELTILIHQPSGEMSGYYFGIYKMMKLFMRSDWVKYALEYGARATESTRATFFYYGKVPGLILGQVLLALILYYLVNKILESCNNRRWFQACLFMYIMRSAITASIMSDFQLLTTKKMILVYIILFFIRNRRIVIRGSSE